MGRFRLPYISPLAAGKVLAAMYFIMALVFMLPFLLISHFAAAEGNTPYAMGMGFGMMVGAVIFYPIAGFIFGVIGAFLYNLTAKMTGGLVFELENAE